MLLGTNKKLSLNIHELAVYFGEHRITDTISYVYLGHTLDPNLQLNNSFQSAYKKASSRVKLMASLHDHLTPEIAMKIYMRTILPILVYMGYIAEAALNCYTEGQATLTGEESFDNHDTKGSFH